MAVADFDPRPAGYRQVNPENINSLLRDLQGISTNNPQSSMWETQLQIAYQDYDISDIDVSKMSEKINILLENLTPPKLMQISGTEGQSQSQKWFQERWLRLTASKCLSAFRIGRLIRSETPNAAVRAFKFIRTNIWKIDIVLIQTYWMKYGLECEPKAIDKYEEQTKTTVCDSGLWVNPKYPFLGCSPDGLVGEDGIIEIKSLKIFKHQSIEDITSPNQSSVPKDVINRQCFKITDGTLELKHGHDYYYQIQLQLLVTERKYCDFVFFAENGPVSIERIFRDEFVIAGIIKFLTSFWIRVIAPEIFEMRVPRNLHPLILPNEIEDVVSNDITLSECSGAASNLSVSAIQVQTDSRDNSLLYENNLTAERKEVPDNSDNYTAEELEVAKLLASSLTDNFIAPSSGEGNNLVVFPWAGTTKNGFQLVNTCQHMSPYMKSGTSTSCQSETCPHPIDFVTSSHITLDYPVGCTVEQNIVLKALDSWLHPCTTRCGRKFPDQLPQGALYFENESLDDNATAHVSWHCSGQRTYSP